MHNMLCVLNLYYNVGYLWYTPHINNVFWYKSIVPYFLYFSITRVWFKPQTDVNQTSNLNYFSDNNYVPTDVNHKLMCFGLNHKLM